MLVGSLVAACADARLPVPPSASAARPGALQRVDFDNWGSLELRGIPPESVAVVERHVGMQSMRVQYLRVHVEGELHTVTDDDAGKGELVFDGAARPGRFFVVEYPWRVTVDDARAQDPLGGLLEAAEASAEER